MTNITCIPRKTNHPRICLQKESAVKNLQKIKDLSRCQIANKLGKVHTQRTAQRRQRKAEKDKQGVLQM